MKTGEVIVRVKDIMEELSFDTTDSILVLDMAQLYIKAQQDLLHEQVDAIGKK